jgi:hypothetical protein
MRSHRGDLRLSNPDWNEYELLAGIRWLRAMLAASCGARPAAAPVDAAAAASCAPDRQRAPLEVGKRKGAPGPAVILKADEPLFPIVDARKTLSWINEEAERKVQGHGLRATFASIAEELVSSALLKRMMNHAAAGDVTLGP